MKTRLASKGQIPTDARSVWFSVTLCVCLTLLASHNKMDASLSLAGAAGAIGVSLVLLILERVPLSGFKATLKHLLGVWPEVLLLLFYPVFKMLLLFLFVFFIKANLSFAKSQATYGDDARSQMFVDFGVMLPRLALWERNGGIGLGLSVFAAICAVVRNFFPELAPFVEFLPLSFVILFAGFVVTSAPVCLGGRGT